jgi:hypothetical protein
MLEAVMFFAVVMAASVCGGGGYLYLPWAWSYSWTR